MRKLRFLIFLLLLSSGLPGRAQESVYSLHISNPQVTAIAQDSDGYIWFGTSRGLNRYNGTNYTTFYASGAEGALNNDHILSLCADSDGTLWVGTECGLNWYRDGKFYHMNTTVFDPVFRVSEADSANISVMGKSGLFLFDKQSLSLTGFTSAEEIQVPSSAETGTIRFTDRDGGLWEADGKNGWNYTAKNQAFRTLHLTEEGERISHPVFDSEGYLWVRVGTELRSYRPETGELIWRDTRHNCNGMHLNQNQHLLVLHDGHMVTEYTTHNGIPHAISTATHVHEMFSMASGADGSLWLSEISDLMKVSPEGTVSHFRIGMEHPFSYILPVAGTKRIFIIGLQEGLLEVKADGTTTVFGEGFFNVSSMLLARDGTFWMGTYNDGLIHYDEVNGTVERFDAASGVADPSIKSLVQDGEGNIWYSTATHLSRFSPWTRTFSGLHDNNFRDGNFYDLLSATRGPDGKLYFGGNGSITVVDPIAFNPERENTPLRLESIVVNEQSRPLETERLELNHRENNLSLRFAGIDFESGQLLDYSWMLEGFDPDWHTATTRPEAVYSLLRPGHYTFRARVRKQNNTWSESQISLPIYIKPAPWASPWAKALYWLLGIGAILSAITLLIRWRTQKDRLALAGQRAELNQQHIDFMTNVSHEFRTPLTMILAPAKELEKSNLPPKEKELTQLICRNAEQLKTLSEQLLSSRGGRGSQEELRVRENDLTSLLRSMAGMFRYTASQKDQELTIDLPDSCIVWYDTEKVSKVLGNLVSNALKYTPEGGHIGISLKREENKAVISVTDDGIGIAPEKRSRIFDRFDRLGAEDTGVIGSGIGLNFAQSMAHLHKGELTYEPNGDQGSIFRFTFPVDAASYPDAVAQGPETPEEPYALSDDDGTKAQTLLIAEDTQEIRLFLRNLFHADYNVILASNGLEAIDNLKLGIPDLVLSDVIMPGKTGYSLCADIRDNPDWSHIPVVLLTAKADAQSSVEGMKAGADAYVPKPFDPDFLKATVEGLLRNRRLLQEKVRDLTSTDLKDPEKAEEVHLNASEKALLEKVQAYLDANLENEEADVADMAREIGMSYSSLYAKLKALTGETPKAYATAYRMNIARELLLSGDYTVSEVADKVGASSPFTFSREYKKHFGFPPSQTLKK